MASTESRSPSVYDRLHNFLSSENESSPSSTTNTAPIDNNCYLLKLPLELQLSIYELVVIQNEPFLLNCPCNSSYRSHYDLLHEHERNWEDGSIRPPTQPALTQTCRLIRHVSLPIFYKENVFRAGYCNTTKMLPAPTKWLRLIGKDNRESLRHLYFYDRNEKQDDRIWYTSEGNEVRVLWDWKKVEESEIFTEMGAREENLSSKHYCAHLVTFGEDEGGRVKAPIAVQDPMRLMLQGEV